jgi:HTTM domain
MRRSEPAFRERLLTLISIDLRSLAAFRIMLSVLLLVDLASRARLLTTNYTDAGVHPRSVMLGLLEPGALPSLHMLAGSTRAELALFVVAGAAAVLLGLGWRTRVFTLVSWLLIDSLHTRNAFVLDGGDHLLRHLLFWSVFLPLGARFSLDARRRVPQRGVSVCSPASAALLLQAASVFLVTGLAKTGPEWTTDYTAIAYAIHRRWWILPFGEWLLAHPVLPRLLTPAVRWFEMLGPFLLFVPVANARFRLLGMLGFWGLLAGLALGFKLNLFPWIAGTALLPFLPTAAWEMLARRFAVLRTLPSRPPAVVPAWKRAVLGLGNVAILGLLLTSVLWRNAATLSPVVAPPAPLEHLVTRLHLAQGWKMYAPSPRHVDVWFEHRGRLANGAAVDLDRAKGGSGWDEVERAWHDYRFLYQLQKLAAPRWEKLAGAYAQWLCRQWNQDREGGARLEHVTVDSVIQSISLGADPEQPPERRRVASALCPL